MKKVLTSKELAIENLEMIVGYMKDKKAGPNSYLEHYADMIEMELRRLKWIFYAIGFLFAIATAGAVDGDASILTVALCSIVGIISFIIGFLTTEKE